MNASPQFLTLLDNEIDELEAMGVRVIQNVEYKSIEGTSEFIKRLKGMKASSGSSSLKAGRRVPSKQKVKTAPVRRAAI